MLRRIATVHVVFDLEGSSEEELRSRVRDMVSSLPGARLAISGPSLAVNGVRLDVPLSERVKL